MEHIESEFTGIKDLKIYYQGWLPESPKAVVQIVHGIGEHSGRYMNVVNELVPLGYAIYAEDLRGHGKSEGERTYIDSFNQFVEDEKLLFDIIKEKHPNLPIFLLGHSMGMQVAALMIKKYGDIYKGIVLSGAGTSAGGEASGFIKFMAKILSKIAPHLKFSSGIDPKTLSHDSEVVYAYENDPLINFEKISARLGYEILKHYNIAEDLVSEIKLPLLLQCGGDDQLVLGAEEVKDFFTMEDKTVKIYDGLYHEVYNEVEKDRKKVLKDLSDWLEKHIK
jgi:acylglycerol lipase